MLRGDYAVCLSLSACEVQSSREVGITLTMVNELVPTLPCIIHHPKGPNLAVGQGQLEDTGYSCRLKSALFYNIYPIHTANSF